MPSRTSAPQASVVLPVYNGALYLGEAIDSVLHQVAVNLELIVIDDGSDDDTPAVLDGYGQQVVRHRQENRGLGAARNAGIERANGDVVAFIDADDRWHPEKLRRQLDVLVARAEIDVVFTHVEQFHSPELTADERAGKPIAREVLAGPVAITCAVRRTALGRVGPFVEHLRVGEFLDWYARAKEANLTMEMLPEVLAYRRIHLTNMGVNEQASRGDYARVLAASLRRRAADQTESNTT